MDNKIILSKEEFFAKKEKYIQLIQKGAVFIYPTDTIYGIGCDAMNESAVKRIHELKQRDTKPFSVIAPSKAWILDNCEVREPELLDLLPGKYTLIFKQNNKNAVAPAVGTETIGVRIPNHWISAIAEELGSPLVTTSVNLSGWPPLTDITSLKQFPVDFIIYEGKKTGRPSTIINTLTGEKRTR